MADETLEPRAVRTPVAGGSIEYLTLPGGPGTPLFVLGGVETGLRHLAGTERMLVQRWASRRRARTVVVLGRPLADDPTAAPRMGHPRVMAAAVAEALDTQAREIIGPVAIEAESGGGRISLWLTVERPDLVERLVLVSVASETPSAMKGALGRWLAYAAAERWAEFFADSGAALRPASEGARPRPPAPGRLVPVPATPERFIAELRATLDPSSFVTGRLHEIDVPALVIAGAEDAVVPPDATRAVAERIPNARFELIPGCGHAVRTDFAGYDSLVETFLTS